MGGLHETLVDTVMKSEKKNPYHSITISLYNFKKEEKELKYFYQHLSVYILSDLLVLKTNHKVLGVIISISCNRMQCNPISSVCFHSSMCPEFNLPMVVHMHRNNCNVLLSVGDLNDIDMSLSS